MSEFESVEIGGEAAPGVDEDECFAAVYPSLRRLAAVVRPADVDADDLVQEAVTRALETRPLDEFNDLGAYLRAAIVNIARNHYRSRERRRRISAQQPAPSDATSDVYPSDLDELRRLSPRDRAILYLSLIEDFPYSRIGSIVGCTEHNARARASRAMRKLRVELRERSPRD